MRRRGSRFRYLKNYGVEAQPLLAKCHDLMQKDLVALNEMINKQSIQVLYLPAKKNEGQVDKGRGRDRALIAFQKKPRANGAGLALIQRSCFKSPAKKRTSVFGMIRKPVSGSVCSEENAPTVQMLVLFVGEKIPCNC